MARTKQATPLRRNPSSEYTSKADATGTPTRSARNLDNGNANGSTLNGHTNVKLVGNLAPKGQKQVGALQLLIAVGGIYGSL